MSGPSPVAACGQRPRPAYVCVCVCANSAEMQTDHWRRRVSEDSGDGEQTSPSCSNTSPTTLFPSASPFHPPTAHLVQSCCCSREPTASDTDDAHRPNCCATPSARDWTPSSLQSSQGRPPTPTCLALRSLSRRLTMDTSPAPVSGGYVLCSRRQRPAPRGVAVGAAAAARGG